MFARSEGNDFRHNMPRGGQVPGTICRAWIDLVASCLFQAGNNMTLCHESTKAFMLPFHTQQHEQHATGVWLWIT